MLTLQSHEQNLNRKSQDQTVNNYSKLLNLREEVQKTPKIDLTVY